MSLPRMIEQERAQAAWEAVAAFKSRHNKDERDRYAALAKKFPMMVLTNGLGQTLAFLRAKGKTEHQALYHDFSAWVSKQIYQRNDDKLLERLMGVEPGVRGDSNTYRRALVETLAFAAWLKRFVEAELDATPNNPPMTAEADTEDAEEAH